MTIRKKTPSFEKLRGSLECGQNTSQQSLARKARDNPTSSHRYMNACKGLFFLFVPFSGFGKKSKSLWEEEGEVGYCNQLPAYDPPVSSIESQEGAMWLQQHWLLLVGCLIVPTWTIDLDLVPEFACTFPFSCPALSQVLGQKSSHPFTSINSVSNLIWVFFFPNPATISDNL